MYVMIMMVYMYVMIAMCHTIHQKLSLLFGTKNVNFLIYYPLWLIRRVTLCITWTKCHGFPEQIRVYSTFLILSMYTFYYELYDNNCVLSNLKKKAKWTI